MRPETGMRCRNCNGKLYLKIGWKSVELRCMDCSRAYSIEEYTHEMDADAWKELANRSCDRV